MRTDLLNRRLRFASPSPVVRRLVLSEADYLLFEAIDRHGPLPSHYLYEFTKHLRRDRTHLQNRLTEFYNGDAEGPFLQRPPQQFASFAARYQHLVYDLAPRAKVALAERGTLVRLAPRRSAPFLHQMMAAGVGASLELCAPIHGLRYIARGEILAHPKCGGARDAANPMAIPLPGASGSALVPDDLFGFEYPGAGFRFYAVEIDRNTESIERKNLAQSAFGRKVAGYLAVLRSGAHQTWWGVPNLHVLAVTTNATHARNILDYIGRHAEPAWAGRFAIATEACFGANWQVPREVLSRLLVEPWETPCGAKDIGAA